MVTKTGQTHRSASTDVVLGDGLNADMILYSLLVTHYCVLILATARHMQYD
jgi:hypothetical protein